MYQVIVEFIVLKIVFLVSLLILILIYLFRNKSSYFKYKYLYCLYNNNSAKILNLYASFIYYF